MFWKKRGIKKFVLFSRPLYEIPFFIFLTADKIKASKQKGDSEKRRDAYASRKNAEQFSRLWGNGGGTSG